MVISIVLLLLIIETVSGANILAFFYFPSISHQYVFRPIVKELSLRGHKVTFVTPNPENDTKYTNLTEIDVSVGYEELKKVDNTRLNRESISIAEFKMNRKDYFEKIITRQMETKGIQQLLEKPSDSFDLLLIEIHTVAFFGLKHKFNAPLIALSTTGAYSHCHDIFGDSIHPILYPDVVSENRGPLKTLMEKIDGIYVFVMDYILDHYFIFPSVDKYIRKYFGQDMPYIEEMMKKANLLLMNVNPIFSQRIPLAPNVIQYYNVHLQRNVTLPDDLKQILDNAKNGAAYFSLGTNVRFAFFQGNIKEVILKALGELPYTVLCKWDSVDFPGKPQNVILRTWFPQQGILAHPNIKIFVTQGGIQSSEEAISNGVPMVVIPFLGDQPTNADALRRSGMAETISPKSITQDVLRNTILKVAEDEKYRLKAQELRNIFLDQPGTGLEKVIWWCEYVLRHKGAEHLRSPGADISLYEYFMLDVFAVILTVIVVTIVMMVFTVKALLRIFRSRKSKTKKQKKRERKED
ncbi:hypothetical protein HHI36_002710 [Cryptolaemus montrouzieri]|uniref:Glucuronosyltransferase n=1 Tax=Cryptolaemus montrouzieri TaxID=559131 RepID=A0ABD2PC86_9CUCU